MEKRTALLLGASGSVGAEILNELLRSSAYSHVVVFVRTPLAVTDSSEKLTQKTVTAMNPVNLNKAVKEVLQEEQGNHVAAFSALGVGAKTAKLTIEQHRAVDVELNRAFADSVRDSARSFALLSAVGANPAAKETGSGAAGMPRYLRVKGESEKAVKAHGPKSVAIFRPAAIRGSQHTPKFFEWLAPVLDFVAPQKWHSISTQQIAKAMVASSLTAPPATGVHEYPEMMRLNVGASV